jgi:hypothetical protein
MNSLKRVSAWKAHYYFLGIEEEFMKKISKLTKVFGFTALLGLCAMGGGGGVIFAQELSFDGVIASGIGLYTAEEETKILAVDNYMEAVGGFFRLNAALDDSEKSAGVKFRLEAQPGNYNQLYPIARYFYGYTNLFGDVITLKGGMVDDGTFATAGASIGDDAGEGLGGLVIIKPFSMVKLGFGAYIGPRSGDKILNIAKAASGDLNAEDAAYTGSMAFGLPDIFDFTLAYRFPFADKDAGTDMPDQLVTGINIRAIQNITLALDAMLKGISDNEITGKYGLTTAFTKDTITVGLNSILQTKDGEDNPAGAFMLYGSYTIQQLVPRLDLYFGIGGTGGTMYYWEYYYEGTTYNTSDKFIGVRPSVTYKASDKISVELGDLIDFRIPDSADTKIDNSVYLSFVYNF